jgi:hypothetical protein
MVNKPVLMTIAISGVLGAGVTMSSVIGHIVIAAALLILVCLTLLALRKKLR